MLNKYNKYLDLLIYNRSNNINFLVYGNEEYVLDYLLNELYPGNHKKKEIIEVNTNKITKYYTSEYIEFNLHEINNIEDFLKIYIKSLCNFQLLDNYINVIIRGIEKIKKKEQFIFRKIIETSSNVKFILVGSNINYLINPIISRCLTIQVPGLLPEDLKETHANAFIKTFIANKYNYKKTLLEQNTNVAIKNMGFNINQSNRKQNYINKLIKFIRNKNITNESIKKINADIFYLYTKLNISHSEIMYSIYLELFNDLDKDFINTVNEYELKMKKSSKNEIHLMAFIFNIKSHLNI